MINLENIKKTTAILFVISLVCLTVYYMSPLSEPEISDADIANGNYVINKPLAIKNITSKEAGWRPKKLCVDGINYKYIPKTTLGAVLHYKEDGMHQSCSIETYPHNIILYRVCDAGKLFYQFQNLRGIEVIEAVKLDGTQRTCLNKKP